MTDMPRVDVERVDRRMLDRPVPPDLDHPDRSLRVIRIQMETIEKDRDRPPKEWTSRYSLPSALNFLAEALEELTWHDLARLAYLEEIALYRQMDAAAPGSVTRRLQGTLTALRRNLMELGRHDEALPVAEEERLVSLGLIGKDRFARQSANDARYWVTELLGRLDRHDEAVESAAAAVREIREQPADPKGTPKPYALAHALATHAECLDRVGRPAEALEVTAEAVRVWRGIGGEAPDRLAIALSNLAERHRRDGRLDAAREALTEAVEILRRPVARGERHLERMLAAALNNLGNHLRAQGQHESALAASEESVARHREIAERTRAFQRRMEESFDEPDEYLEYQQLRERHRRRDRELGRVRKAELLLGIALANHGTRLSALGRLDESLTTDDESIAICRRHSGADPQQAEPGLAMALNNRTITLHRLARFQEAVDTAREAVALYRRLTESDPQTYEPKLAMAHNTFCASASELGHHDEALAASAQAVDTYRRLHAADPTGYAGYLADALTEHGLVRSRRGEHDDALAATEEAVRLYRPLAEQNPGRYGAELARALTVFAEVRGNARRSLADARAAVQEAVTHYEALAADLPQAYGTGLARARSVLGDLNPSGSSAR